MNSFEEIINFKENEVNDYSIGILHLAWFVTRIQQDSNLTTYRQLIWGMVELLPSDSVFENNIKYLTSKEQNIDKKGSNSYWYIRLDISLKDVSKIYNEIKANKKFEMFWEKQSKEKKYIHIGDYSNAIIKEEPSNSGDFQTHNNSEESRKRIPFIGSNWDCTRIKAFFSNSFNFVVQYLNEKIIEKYKEEIGWNFNEYIEFIGSFWFVLPNPIYKNIETHLDYEKANTEEENIIVSFEPRNFRNLNEISVVCLEKRNIGYRLLNKLPIKGNYLELSVKENCENLGILVLCDKRGLISYYPYTSFIRKINVDFRIKTADISIEKHDKSGIIHIYRNNFYGNIEEVYIGETLNSDNSLNQKNTNIQTLKYKHWPQEKESNQKLFGPNNGGKERATEYIRSLINSANHQITIIDPYFAENELILFATAISNSNVYIKIITSKTHLESKISNETNKFKHKNIITNFINKLSEIFISKIKFKRLESFKKSIIVGEYKQFREKLQLPENKLSINLMIGKEPIFHDRFLIIDSDVYLLGSSLNSIGGRISMIIKIESNQLIQEIEDLTATEKIKTFESVYGIQ